MKHLFEVDTAHTARTGIALGASAVIAIVAATTYDRVIAVSATVFITLIAIAVIKEQKAKTKSPSTTN